MNDIIDGDRIGTIRLRIPDKDGLRLLAVSILATVCCVFSFGGQTFPLAGWAFPALMLYTSRSLDRKKGMILPIVLMAIAIAIAYYTTFELLGMPILQVLVCMLLGAMMSMPFVLDRFLHDGFTDVQRLLFLPFLVSSIEVLQSLTFAGNINSLAYSQMGFLAAEQMVSVIGSTGLTFMICLFGTSVNLLIERYKEKRSFERKAIICILVVIIAVAAGGVRLATADVSEDRMSVLCTEGPGVYVSDDEKDIPYENNIDYLDVSVEKALDAGVVMLVASEDAFRVDGSRVDEFRSYVELKSVESGLYIMYGLGVNEGKDQIWNTCAFVSPSNGTEWVYNKTHLIPLFEFCRYSGDGTIYHTDTEFGCITSVICMDLEFPAFVSTIYDGSDILISPSYDWHGLETWHTRNDSLRAIENGVSFLRNTAVGTIGSYDYLGHEITQVTYAGGAEDCYVIEVPTDSCGTVFGTYGVAIVWLYVIGFLIVLSPSFQRAGSFIKNKM